MPDAAPHVLASKAGCPFLEAADGAWRMTVPDREHRCAAFVPATSLAPTKQSRLCLTPAHLGCATYVASIKARAARTGSAEPPVRAGRWAFARTTPVVEQVGGLRASVTALLTDRRTWPVIPALLLVSLLVALGVSGGWGQTPLTAVGSPPPSSPPAATIPTATLDEATLPVERVQPSTTPSPSLSPSPSSAPTPTPAPTYRTYRVQSGDTLYTIAQRFHTTVSALTALNHITDPGRLHIGQVLLLP